MVDDHTSLNRRTVLKSMSFGTASIGASGLVGDASAASGSSSNNSAKEVFTGQEKNRLITAVLKTSAASKIKKEFVDKGFKLDPQQSMVGQWTHEKRDGPSKVTDKFAILDFEHNPSSTSSSQPDSVFILWTTLGNINTQGYEFPKAIKKYNMVPAVEHTIYAVTDGEVTAQKIPYRPNKKLTTKEVQEAKKIHASTQSTGTATTQAIAPSPTCTPVYECTGHVDYEGLIAAIITGGIATAERCAKCVEAGELLEVTCGICVAIALASGIGLDKTCKNGYWKDCGCYAIYC